MQSWRQSVALIGYNLPAEGEGGNFPIGLMPNKAWHVLKRHRLLTSESMVLGRGRRSGSRGAVGPGDSRWISRKDSKCPLIARAGSVTGTGRVFRSVDPGDGTEKFIEGGDPACTDPPPT